MAVATTVGLLASYAAYNAVESGHISPRSEGNYRYDWESSSSPSTKTYSRNTQAINTACFGLLGLVLSESVAPTVEDVQDSSREYEAREKGYRVYAPERKLPLDENGVEIPDSNNSHTQLGTRGSKKGAYPQAREFGRNGTKIRDINFTDHGKRDVHTNPHQHRWGKNKTRGSLGRGGPEPLPGWKYL